MMYKAWIRPGRKPKRQRHMLTNKSIDKPRLTATGIGGTKIEMNTRNQSRACIIEVGGEGSKPGVLAPLYKRLTGAPITRYGERERI